MKGSTVGSPGGEVLLKRLGDTRGLRKMAVCRQDESLTGEDILV